MRPAAWTVTPQPDGSILIGPPPTASPPVEADRLIAFPFGLEEQAARGIVKRGVLVTAKIGRKRYAKQSAVLALVDILHAEEQALPSASDETDREAYLRLVARR